MQAWSLRRRSRVNPRLAQGMAEKVFNRVPFVSQWTARTGQLTGLPRHAANCSSRIACSWSFRKALGERPNCMRPSPPLVLEQVYAACSQNEKPDRSFAFVGGGEAYRRSTAQKLGKLLGAPTFPSRLISSHSLPVRLGIVYGDPMISRGTAMRTTVSSWATSTKSRTLLKRRLLARCRANQQGGRKPMKVLLVGIADRSENGSPSTSSPMATKSTASTGGDGPRRGHRTASHRHRNALRRHFRTVRPEAVVHMAHRATSRPPTKNGIESPPENACCIRSLQPYGCKRRFVGRHTYYGAAADSPLYHCEDEPPLNGELSRARRFGKR